MNKNRKFQLVAAIASVCTSLLLVDMVVSLSAPHQMMAAAPQAQSVVVALADQAK